jgi:hypothetical protein
MPIIFTNADYVSSKAEALFLSSSLGHVGTKLNVRFEVLTAVSTKMAVFWVVTQCCLVEVYQRFRGDCCLHRQGDEWVSALMMEAANTYETMVNFFQATRRYSLEDSHLRNLNLLHFPESSIIFQFVIKTAHWFNVKYKHQLLDVYVKHQVISSGNLHNVWRISSQELLCSMEIV